MFTRIVLEREVVEGEFRYALIWGIPQIGFQEDYAPVQCDIAYAVSHGWIVFRDGMFGAPAVPVNSENARRLRHLFQDQRAAYIRLAAENGKGLRSDQLTFPPQTVRADASWPAFANYLDEKGIRCPRYLYKAFIVFSKDNRGRFFFSRVVRWEFFDQWMPFLVDALGGRFGKMVTAIYQAANPHLRCRSECACAIIREKNVDKNFLLVCDGAYVTDLVKHLARDGWIEL